MMLFDTHKHCPTVLLHPDLFRGTSRKFPWQAIYVIYITVNVFVCAIYIYTHILTRNCASHEVVHLAAQFPWTNFALSTSWAAGRCCDAQVKTCRDMSRHIVCTAAVQPQRQYVDTGNKSKAPVTMMDPQMRSSVLPQRPLEPRSQRHRQFGSWHEMSLPDTSQRLSKVGPMSINICSASSKYIQVYSARTTKTWNTRPWLRT